MALKLNRKYFVLFENFAICATILFFICVFIISVQKVEELYVVETFPIWIMYFLINIFNVPSEVLTKYAKRLNYKSELLAVLLLSPIVIFVQGFTLNQIYFNMGRIHHLNQVGDELDQWNYTTNITITDGIFDDFYKYKNVIIQDMLLSAIIFAFWALLFVINAVFSDVLSLFKYSNCITHAIFSAITFIIAFPTIVICFFLVSIEYFENSWTEIALSSTLSILRTIYVFHKVFHYLKKTKQKKHEEEKYNICDIFIDVIPILIVFLPGFLFTGIKSIFGIFNRNKSLDNSLQKRQSDLVEFVERKINEVIKLLEESSLEFTQTLKVNTLRIRRLVDENMGGKSIKGKFYSNKTEILELAPLYTNELQEKLNEITHSLQQDMDEIKAIFQANINKFRTDINEKVQLLHMVELTVLQNPSETVQLLPKNIAEISTLIDEKMNHIKTRLRDSEQEFNLIMPGIVGHGGEYVILEQDLITSFSLNVTEVTLKFQQNITEIAQYLLENARNVPKTVTV